MVPEPLISIIIPVYNAEQNLKRCLDSILSQTYTRLQIILVDDGSTDQSYAICKTYQEKDERVVLLKQANSGVSQARNHGLSVAEGKYIGFVDSDDYIEKQMYEQLLHQMLTSGSKLCACNYFYETENGHNINSFSSNELVFSSQLLPEYMFTNLSFAGFLWNKLYDRELIFHKEPLLLDSTIKIMEDNLFHYQIFENNAEFTCSYINERLYHYVRYVTSASHATINKKSLQYFIVREKQITILEKHGKVSDFLKADYVVNFVKTNIKYFLLRLPKDDVYMELWKKSKRYKHQVRMKRLNRRTRIKYTIARWLPVIYLVHILVKKENI